MMSEEGYINNAMHRFPISEDDILAKGYEYGNSRNKSRSHRTLVVEFRKRWKNSLYIIYYDTRTGYAHFKLIKFKI